MVEYCNKSSRLNSKTLTFRIRIKIRYLACEAKELIKYFWLLEGSGTIQEHILAQCCLQIGEEWKYFLVQFLIYITALKVFFSAVYISAMNKWHCCIELSMYNEMEVDQKAYLRGSQISIGSFETSLANFVPISHEEDHIIWRRKVNSMINPHIVILLIAVSYLQMQTLFRRRDVPKKLTCSIGFCLKLLFLCYSYYWNEVG